MKFIRPQVEEITWKELTKSEKASAIVWFAASAIYAGITVYRFASAIGESRRIDRELAEASKRFDENLSKINFFEKPKDEDQSPEMSDFDVPRDENGDPVQNSPQYDAWLKARFAYLDNRPLSQADRDKMAKNDPRLAKYADYREKMRGWGQV